MAGRDVTNKLRQLHTLHTLRSHTHARALATKHARTLSRRAWVLRQRDAMMRWRVSLADILATRSYLLEARELHGSTVAPARALACWQLAFVRTTRLRWAEAAVRSRRTRIQGPRAVGAMQAAVRIAKLFGTLTARLAHWRRRTYLASCLAAWGAVHRGRLRRVGLSSSAQVLTRLHAHTHTRTHT